MLSCHRVALLGGSGFIGVSIANLLSDAGIAVRVPTRDRDNARTLWTLPGVDVMEADVHDSTDLHAVLDGCDAVINLVGILNEKGDDGSGFNHVHVELPRKVLEACSRLGISRLLHMSALNAAVDGPSHYLRSKGEAEKLVHEAVSRGIAPTSFRPSVVFGPGDSFFNRFADLLKVTPLAFPLACPGARFAPVYVGDVAQAFVGALTDPGTVDRRYQLCGPEVFTFRELVAMTCDYTGHQRMLIPLPDALARLQANVFEYVPGKPFSRDNLRSLSVDSVCGAGPGLAELGIKPTPVASVVGSYLGSRGSERARYDGFRSRARR